MPRRLRKVRAGTRELQKPTTTRPQITRGRNWPLANLRMKLQATHPRSGKLLGEAARVAPRLLLILAVAVITRT